MSLPSEWWKLADANVGGLDQLLFDPEWFAAAFIAPSDPAYAYGQSWPSGAKAWQPGDLFYQLAREVGDSGTQIYNELTEWGKHWLNAGASGGDTYLWVIDGDRIAGIVLKEAKGLGRLYTFVDAGDGRHVRAIPTDTVYEGFGEASFLANWGWLLPIAGALATQAMLTYFGSGAAAAGATEPVASLVTAGTTTTATGAAGSWITPSAITAATTAGSQVAATAAQGAAESGVVAATGEAINSAVNAASDAFSGFNLTKFVDQLSRLYASYASLERTQTALPKPGYRTTLPDGSIVTVNPDGSTTITDSGGSVATVGAGGVSSGAQSWLPGVSNQTVLLGALALAAVFLLSQRR
jgi:hypothetical protein